MRIITASIIAAAACAVALAAPVTKQGGMPVRDDKPISPVLVVDEPEPGRPGPILFVDGDKDGFDNVIDCNDDSFDINPTAAEIANGFDDDCDGVVDDGFDTSADLPESPLSVALWPELAIPGSTELISMDAPPRVIWNGSAKAFVAVWVDAAERLRAARFQADGVLIDNPPVIVQKPARRIDVAWTGTRLGIVYEDVSAEGPAVRFITLDADLGALGDPVIIAPAGTEPKIAWGQDRFGIVWKVPYGLNTLRFQTFDRGGVPFTPEPEMLINSGRNASIAFSGGAVDTAQAPWGVREGAFGIAFEAIYGFAASGDVILATRPWDPAFGTPRWVQVNAHLDKYTATGALPAVAANPAGFAVAWHVLEGDKDRASLRYFSLDTLTPVQEFTPDADAGRSARVVWTGSEFVIANDNVTSLPLGEYDIHFRRVDPSCNTHLAAGWGPWTELNLSSAVAGGTVSTHPDLTNTGDAFGVVWLEKDTFSGGGRLWFAKVTHK